VGDKKTLTRHLVRRKLDQCAAHCNHINQHLAEAAQPFEDAGHEVHMAFIRLGEMTELLRNFLLEVRSNI